MIYVSAIAKWAQEQELNHQIAMPGTLQDFFYETDDPTFFDKYSLKESV